MDAHKSRQKNNWIISIYNMLVLLEPILAYGSFLLLPVWEDSAHWTAQNRRPSFSSKKWCTTFQNPWELPNVSQRHREIGFVIYWLYYAKYTNIALLRMVKRVLNMQRHKMFISHMQILRRSTLLVPNTLKNNLKIFTSDKIHTAPSNAYVYKLQISPRVRSIYCILV